MVVSTLLLTSYPTTTFVVQCLNPKEPLKLRVSVTDGDYELAGVSITSSSNLLSKGKLIVVISTVLGSVGLEPQDLFEQLSS